MYAVVRTGGKQYRVAPGQQLRVDRLPGEAGDMVNLNEVLLINNDKVTTVDENGFVVDFGELHYISDWIDEHLDHACAFSASDPHRSKIEELAKLKLVHPLFIENASCEGLAKHLFETFDPMVRENTGGRARIVSIDLEEDSKNSAFYRP